MVDETDETEVTLSESLRGLGQAILALYDPLDRLLGDLEARERDLADAPQPIPITHPTYYDDLEQIVTRLRDLVGALGATLSSVPDVAAAPPGPPPYDWEQWVQDLGEHATPEARDLADTWWQAVDRLIGAEIGD